MNFHKFKIHNPFTIIVIGSILFHVLLFLLPYTVERKKEDAITVELVFDLPEQVIPKQKTTTSVKTDALPVKATKKKRPEKQKPLSPPSLALNKALGNPSAKKASMSSSRDLFSKTRLGDNVEISDAGIKQIPDRSYTRPDDAILTRRRTSSTKVAKLAGNNTIDRATIPKNTTPSTALNTQNGSENVDKVSFVTGLNGRKIIFKPELPEINTLNTNTVQFMVVILPSGDVSQVTPYKKGNLSLEREGIKFIRRFKFEPIFSEIIQKGIIELSVIRGKITER